MMHLVVWTRRLLQVCVEAAKNNDLSLQTYTCTPEFALVKGAVPDKQWSAHSSSADVSQDSAWSIQTLHTRSSYSDAM